MCACSQIYQKVAYAIERSSRNERCTRVNTIEWHGLVPVTFDGCAPSLLAEYGRLRARFNLLKEHQKYTYDSIERYEGGHCIAENSIRL